MTTSIILPAFRILTLSSTCSYLCMIELQKKDQQSDQVHRHSCQHRDNIVLR